jgi:hypothetical protein
MASLQGGRAYILPPSNLFTRPEYRNASSYQSSVSKGINSSGGIANCLQISSMLMLSTCSVQELELEIKYQSSTLCGIADSVTAISQSFGDLKTICAKSDSSHEQTLAAIESTRQMLM